MTRTAIEARIFSLYVGDGIVQAYNISTIAKRIGAAYPHVHAAVHEMVENGLLETRNIGNAVFCSPNLGNDFARNLLAHAALLEKHKIMNSPNEQNMTRAIRELAMKHPELLCALYTEEGICFVVPNKDCQSTILRDTNLYNIRFLLPNELRDELLDDIGLLKRGISLHGYDNLLLILQPIQSLLFNQVALSNEVAS